MNKVALIIIYNHKYDKNIEVLERIYRDRFSNIYHLVPFYKGNRPNVIPVYENSYYFQGFLAQGFRSFFKEAYDHYFFIADDLILNPIIDENNYTKHLKLNKNTCFLPGFITLHDKNSLWTRIHSAFDFNIDIQGLEVKNELPDYNAAMLAFNKFGLEIKPINFDLIWRKPKSLRKWIKRIITDKTYLFRFFSNQLKSKNYNLSYPMVASYSDIFVVSSDSIKQFCQHCGVFAATNLFVEIGLPTSIVLSAQEIVTEKDLEFQGKALWPDGQVRLACVSELAKDDYKELEKFNYNLKELLETFPENYLYLHPIKLSKWKTEL